MGHNGPRSPDLLRGRKKAKGRKVFLVSELKKFRKEKQLNAKRIEASFQIATWDPGG